MKRSLVLFASIALSVATAQTAADKITAGRAALAAHDLATAQVRFQEALALNPTAQTASALLGITRCANVVSLTSSQNFLDRLGVSGAGRNVYRWDTTFTYDLNGEIVLPANFNLNEASDLWLGTLIPQSEQARASLALVTNPTFLLTLTAAETGLPIATNIDYGDLVMARAFLRAAEYLAHSSSSHNLNVNLGALRDLSNGNLLTLQRAMLDNPDFLKPGALAERTAARAALLDTIALYREASAFIRARPAGLSRLFAIDPVQLAEEADFRATLDKAERSLSEPIHVGDNFLTTAPMFTPDWSLRAALPVFTATGFDLTSLTDPTIGGMVAGLTREALAALFTSSETAAELGWEWVSPTPQGDALLRYVPLAGGKHLVTGNAGVVLSSDDGANWVARRIPGAGRLTGVAAGVGKVVAVTDGGKIYLSRDSGVTWSKVDEGYGTFRSLTYGGGRFVAVGDFGTCAVSADGEAWTYVYPGNHTLVDVTFTGSRYLAVGVDYTQSKASILSSPDAFTWTTRFTAATTGTVFNAVASGGGKFVAVGAGNQRATSADAVNWTAGTVLASGTTTFNGIGYRNGYFAAVGSSGAIAISADGAAWTSVTGETLTLFGVGVGPDAIYVAANAGAILRSTDGVTFSRVLSPQSATALGTALRGSAVIDNQLYVVGSGGLIARSGDGLTYTTLTSGTTNALYAIMKQGSTFYAVGDAGTILASGDGTSWTARTSGTTVGLRSLAYLNGQFVAGGASGTVLTSPDGITWTVRPTGGTGTLFGIVYGNGTYVAGNSSTVNHFFTSPDAITWTARPIGIPQSFRAIVFDQGMFTAAGNEGVIFRSSNGATWNRVATSAVTDIFAMRAIGGHTYALQSTSSSYSLEPETALVVSSNGQDWVRCVQGTGNTENAVELFQNRIYTFGNAGTILRSRPLTATAVPVLRVLTSNKLSPQGDHFSIAVAANGDGAMAYQWQKDGTPIPGATSTGIELVNIQSADAGSYTLTATNAAGSAVSPAIVLTVSSTPVVPVFATQPQSQTVNVGLPVTFSVTANGTLPIAYQWKKDGVAIADATTAALTIASVQPSSAGTYTVLATNVAGATTSAAATLTCDGNPAYTFTTLAGFAAFAGSTDGTGSAARFNSPGGVAVDSAGNVYVADSSNHTIRKITPAGVVTTVAGTAGSSGNVNATGATARFNYPRGLALDAAGANLYVADSSNSAIRKIALSTGAVTQFAGVTSPVYLAIDSAGNLFVSSGNHTVQKVTAAGVVSTWAGSSGLSGSTNGVGSLARFNSPQGVALDAAGNLYVVDGYNFTIRRIAPDATVTTVAGQVGALGVLDGPALAATFYYPVGIAVDPAGGVFVSDYSGNTIRKLAGGVVRTIGGQSYWSGSADGIGADARFAAPSGLAVDSSGKLYVADTYNYAIRRGTPSASPLLPIIATQPAAQVGAAGGSVTFAVSASGVTPLSYQWMKDGAALAGATNSSLTLANIQGTDAGAYSVQLTNSQGTTLSAAAVLTIQIVPTITTQPAGKLAAVESGITLAVTAAGSGPLGYQWKKDGVALNDDSRITGATTATLSLANLALTDAGSYTVAVANAVGNVTSNAAVLTVVDARATHAVAGGGYYAGGLVTIAQTLTYAGGCTGLTWQLLLPAGWSYASDAGSTSDTKPAVGAVNLLEWIWNTGPASPVSFTVNLNVPAGATGDKTISSLAIFRTAAGPANLLVKPDPLVVSQVTHHSADPDLNLRISLVELTRVIELYSTRNGTTRTGNYMVQAGTEDGFAQDPARAANAVVTLAGYHSGDSDHNGKLSLFELTRVIELYNYRSGTVRTGQYHLQFGTEDGFGLGP